MPMEEYALFAIKDIFVNKMKMKLKSSTNLSLKSKMIYSRFVVNIDTVGTDVFFGASEHCLRKINTKMSKQVSNMNDDELDSFLKNLVSVIINSIKVYASQKDKRDISISVPIKCSKIEETRYDILRSFSLDDEDLVVAY